MVISPLHETTYSKIRIFIHCSEDRSIHTHVWSMNKAESDIGADSGDAFVSVPIAVVHKRCPPGSRPHNVPAAHCHS